MNGQPAAYWATTLSSIRRGEPDWAAIAAYEAPVRRFVARRFPSTGAAERDDLVQDVLVAMRERIVPRYAPSRGPFRSFLCAAVLNRARDRLRRARPGVQLEGDDDAALASVDDREADALDLEAEVVRAVQAVHDRFGRGAGADLPLVYCLSGVLVHGLGNAEVARREGLSVDQVKRKLQAARAAILEALLARLLPEGGPAHDVARAAELARACLREPRRAERLLEAERDARVREAVSAFAGWVRATCEAERGLDGSDLARGVAAVFQGE